MVAVPSASTCHLTDHIAYMATNSGEFGTVDLDTGVFSLRQPPKVSMAGIVAIDGLNGGSYRAGTGTLYTINTANGALTTVGTSAVDYDTFGGTMEQLYAIGTDTFLYSVNPHDGVRSGDGQLAPVIRRLARPFQWFYQVVLSSI